MNKELVSNVEFLLDELHKQWLKSKHTVKLVVLTEENLQKVRSGIINKTYDMDKAKENGNISFKKSVKVSKDGYVCIRLANKVKKILERLDSKEELDADAMILAMDEEEYQMYKQMVKN